MRAVENSCGPVREVPICHLVRWATVTELRRLADWLRREQADILHAWDADAAIFGQFAAQWAGVKLITSRRDLGQIYPWHKMMLMRHADRAAVRVVANAEAVRRHFMAGGLPGNKIVVLPNLMDLEDFDARASTPFSVASSLPEGCRMVVVNRLDPEKNTGLLIDALPLVRQQIPDAVLIIAGDGREMPMLKTRAAALGLSKAVCFLGETHEVPALLRLCQAGALVPSRNEGLSNTILEYMAAGLPVLATDCGGNRELVRDGVTGRVVQPDAKAEEVSRAWINLMQGDGKAMGRTGRGYVAQRHARDQVVDAFASFYRHLARSGAPSV